MESVGIFPFGQPIYPVVQKDRSKKRVFVLGVYASAVHARWIGENGKRKISAVAVTSEPEIFWRGSPEEAQTCITKIKLPAGAGWLMPATSQLNGPSGRALDERILQPLKLSRDDAWLCDLVPYSCMNEKQEAALKREKYEPSHNSLGLPRYDWPRLPDEKEWADSGCRTAIERELEDSGAKIVITLGDQPLKWFTKYHGSESALSAYGKTRTTYGQLQPLTIGGRKLRLLPLVHPRQAGRLGSHSTDWANLHDAWMQSPPQIG